MGSLVRTADGGSQGAGDCPDWWTGKDLRFSSCSVKRRPSAPLAEGPRRVLRPLVRVMDHGLGTAVLDRHGERVLDEFAAQVRLHAQPTTTARWSHPLPARTYVMSATRAGRAVGVEVALDQGREVGVDARPPRTSGGSPPSCGAPRRAARRRAARLPNADASATRRSRSGRGRGRGTSRARETRPGASSRTRTLSGDRAALPGEPSRGFFGMSRLRRSCLFSRFRRRSSSRSRVVVPSSRRPSSTSACLTQLQIVGADGRDQ